MSSRRQPAAAASRHQQEVTKRRNQSTIRLARLDNGYLLTFMADGRSRACLTRADLHQAVDDFFDAVEEGTAELGNLPEEAWRQTSVGARS